MIQIRNLRAGYDGRTVLSAENLDLAAGQITGILGANGNGKSTLLSAIESSIPYQGSIQIDEMESRNLTERERAKLVAFLPQNTPRANLTVEMLVSHGRFAYLGFSRILSPRDREIVEEAMEMTDVADLRHRYLTEISGGEKQRAYIAMAAAQKSRMLLLDEPTTGLDIRHQWRIMEILKKLASSGTGIVMTSHDIPETVTVSDRLVLIGKAQGVGQVLEEGKKEEVLSHQDLFVRCLGAGVVRIHIPGQLCGYTLVRGGAEDGVFSDVHQS